MLNVLLTSLSISFHQNLDSFDMLNTLLLRTHELIDQKIFANKYTLFINNVIKLALLFFNNILLVIFLIIIVLLIIEFLLLLFIRIDTSCLCITVVVLHVKLIKNVLNLSFELIIALLHQVLQDLGHAKLFRFFSKFLSCEN